MAGATVFGVSLLEIMSSPYSAPTSSEATGAIDHRRAKWPIVVASLWIVFLTLALPAVPVSRLNPPPAGTFLPIKIGTTSLSVIATMVLLLMPRRRWLYLNLPILGFLFMVQRSAWTQFP